jgi:hypothetical protein
MNNEATMHPVLYPVAAGPVKRRQWLYDVHIDPEVVKDTWIFVGGIAIDLTDAVRWNGMGVLGEYEAQLKTELDKAEYHLEEMDDDIGFYLDSDGHLSWIIEQCRIHSRSVMRSLSILTRFRESNPVVIPYSRD